MTSSSATLHGVGLRSGCSVSVTLHARAGPFAFRVGGQETTLAGLRVGDVSRATTVHAGVAEIATVEHLLAACAGLGLHHGVVAEVVGGELPLLDGGAGVFVEALRELAVPSSRPTLRILRDATLTHEASRYTFRRGATTSVEVTLSYDDPRIAPDAAWHGSVDDFATRVASARTFAFAHEVAALVSAGHAAHVDATSVVVFAVDAVLSSGARFTPDEPARHKLLDLVGDLFVYGGPPIGSVHAFRPGHRATHAIARQALDQGILAR